MKEKATATSPGLYVAVVKGEETSPKAAWTAFVSVSREEVLFTAMAAKVRQSGTGSGFRVFIGTLEEVVEIAAIKTSSVKGKTHLVDDKPRPKKK